MDDPPSDGNGRVADIFILSTDETVAVPLKKHLEKKEYRVTIFPDDATLKEPLPTKPDLIICDTTTGEQEGYDVIRRIRADENNWGIPVLALTAASTMEDLLNVLESNADNFIAPPYDLPDNLSLVESMLTTPVEQPARYEVERQFRVRYGDKTYLVPAVSRKLLECLLSSFDILVRTSSELSEVTTQLKALTASAIELEQTIAGQTQATETLHETVRNKEQQIIALTREGEDVKTQLQKKTNELTDLTGELAALRQQVEKLQEMLNSSTKALESERELRRVLEENVKAAVQQQEDLEKHNLKATEELERVNKDQAALVGHLKEELEKAARQIQSLETEVRTFATEKMHAEQEIRALSESTTDREQTIARLTQATETLKEEVRQKGQTILASALECEELKKSLKKEIEERNNLTTEFAALKQQVGKLQETLTSSIEELETERTLRRVSEEIAKAAVQRQEDIEKQTRRANEELERVHRDQAGATSQINEELKKAASQIQSLESEVNTLAAEKMHAEQEVRTLTAALAHTRTMGANVGENHPDIDEGHADVGKERHIAQQSLLTEEKKIRKESRDLVLSEKSNLPTPVQKLAQPITREIIPGLQQPLVSNKEVVHGEPSGEIPPVLSGVISQLPEISDPDTLFLVHEPDANKEDTAPGPIKDQTPSEEKTIGASLREQSSAVHDQTVQPGSYAEEKPEKEMAEKPEIPRSEASSGTQSDETAAPPQETAPGGIISFTSAQWLDLLRWAHHSDALSRNQRQKIVMMGRLVQKDGKLTKRQQEQIREIFSFAYALGYHP